MTVQLRDDLISLPERVLRIEHRIESRDGLKQSNENGRLLDVQAVRRLVKVCLRGDLDTIRVAAEGRGVEIHGNDLFLREVLFEIDGDDPFFCLLDNALHRSPHRSEEHTSELQSREN